MLRRLITGLTLACYGALALGGQGLHVFVHDHGRSTHVHAADPSSCHSHGKHKHACCHHGKSTETKTPAAGASHRPKTDRAGQWIAYPRSAGCNHDSHTCGICQHHSQGQLSNVAPPVVTGLAHCSYFKIRTTEVVVCAARYSPAQPRAPPAAC